MQGVEESSFTRRAAIKSKTHRISRDKAIQARTGKTRLNNGQLFRASFDQFIAHIADDGKDPERAKFQFDPDLSVDDIRTLTPVAAIDRALKQEMARPPASAASVVSVPARRTRQSNSIPISIPVPLSQVSSSSSSGSPFKKKKTVIMPTPIDDHKHSRSHSQNQFDKSAYEDAPDQSHLNDIDFDKQSPFAQHSAPSTPPRHSHLNHIDFDKPSPFAHRSSSSSSFDKEKSSPFPSSVLQSQNQDKEKSGLPVPSATLISQLHAANKAQLGSSSASASASAAPPSASPPPPAPFHLPPPPPRAPSSSSSSLPSQSEELLERKYDSAHSSPSSASSPPQQPPPSPQRQQQQQPQPENEEKKDPVLLHPWLYAEYKFSPGEIPSYADIMHPIMRIRKERRRVLPRARFRDVNSISQEMFETDLANRTGNRPPRPFLPNEVLIKVSIFRPHSLLNNKMQEFILLGSQPLSVLKDSISCLSDSIFEGKLTPSSTIFIENVFHDDMRDPAAIRYSETVLRWVHSEKRFSHPGLDYYELGSDMADTPLRDIGLRLGSHYLYAHQGDCQHVIIFTDMWIPHERDVQDSAVYPLKAFQCKYRKKKCRVCNIFQAKFVTYGDVLANENPFFYCEECYRPMHYSKEGHLLYDYQVYPYFHEE